MMKRTLVTAASAIAMFAISAFAVDLTQVEQSIPLKDGSTVYVFKGGKMGMEDKYGRATRMEPGVLMEGKDGHKYAMIGDEVARVQTLLNQDKRK